MSTTAALILFPSFNHEHFSLPCLTRFSNKHKHLAPQTQTQKQTQPLFLNRNIALLLGRGHLRRLSSSAQDEAPLPEATTEPSNTKVPISKYLAERLGISQENSLVISKKLKTHRKYCGAKPSDIISSDNADIVISYLQDENRLDLSQVKKVVTKYPIILVANVDKTLKPKVRLVQDLGFSTSDLALVISYNPRLYLTSDLSPAIQALRDIMGSDEYVVKVLKRFKRGAATEITNNLIPNVTMLENEYGIPRDKLREVLTKTPLPLLNQTEWLRDVLVRMEDKWGISSDSKEFFRAIHIFSGFTEKNINSKCQVFRSYGWSDSDILSLIRRHPTCLSYSEAGMRKKLDFYMKELGYEPAYMASRTALFGLSLENRVVPRHRVLEVLKEKGLVKSEYQLCSALTLSEDVFYNRFILKFQHVVPRLHQVLINGTEAMPLGEASENKTEDLLLE